jgi:hypothetical protein
MIWGLLATSLGAQTKEEEAARIGVEVLVRCEKLIDELTTESAAPAVEALLGDAKVCFPVLLARMDDFRSMGVRHLSFRTGPDAAEALLHYGPKKVVDCLTILLSRMSGQSFGSLHNGGSDEKRRAVIRAWRDWYDRAKPFLRWDEARNGYRVDDEAWVAGTPTGTFRTLTEAQRRAKLERAFAQRDELCRKRAGFAPRTPEGKTEALLAWLKKDPYRPLSFDSPPWISETMKKLAVSGRETLPAIAYAYHRTFDKAYAASLAATLGEMGTPGAKRTLQVWRTFEHRQHLVRTIDRMLAKMP